MNIVAELKKPHTVREWWNFIHEYKYVRGLKIIEIKDKIIAYGN